MPEREGSVRWRGYEGGQGRFYFFQWNGARCRGGGGARRLPQRRLARTISERALGAGD